MKWTNPLKYITCQNSHENYLCTAIKQIKYIINSFPKLDASAPDWALVNFNKHLRKVIHPLLTISYRKRKQRENFLIYYETSITPISKSGKHITKKKTLQRDEK